MKPPGQLLRGTHYVRRPGDYLSSHGFVKDLKCYAEEAGSLSEVQEALGHKDLNTTRVYLERVSKQKDRHSRRLAQRLGL